MKKNIILAIILTIFFSIILVACSSDKSYRSVKIFSFRGTCNIIRGNKQLELVKEQKIKNNDELQVKEESQAILKLDSDKFVCVKENTSVKFVATGKENKTKTRLHVNNGGVVVEVKEKLKDSESFEIASSNSVMAIRGTQISFDVDKTSDSVTTTFSILTGQTETFLYKDETMNSTTLVHDKMMSYTTSLNKTTDEIYDIYDSLEKVSIDDNDLETIYNTTKEDLTVDKANEIIGIVNEFERDEKIDERTSKEIVDLNIDSSIEYGSNLYNHFLNENKLNLYYRSNSDSEFVLYEGDNYLNIGSYEVKLYGSNYESEIKTIEITKANINLPINFTQSLENGEFMLNVSLDDNVFLNSPFALEKDGREYKYNIGVTLTMADRGTLLDTFILDYNTKEHIYTFANPINIDVAYVFNLPTDVFSVKNDTEYLYNFEPMFVSNNFYLSTNDNSTLAYSSMNYYHADGSYIGYYANYKMDDSTEYIKESLETDTRTNEKYINLGNTGNFQTLSIYYTVEQNDEILDRSSELVYSFDNLNLSANYEYNFNSDNSFFTYNSNTINAYFDTGFVNNSNYDLSYKIDYALLTITNEVEYSYSNVKSVFESDRYAVINDIPKDGKTYAICGFRVCYTDEDGLVYMISEDENDYSMDLYKLYSTTSIVFGSGESTNDGYVYELTVNVSNIYPLDNIEIVLTDEENNKYTFNNFDENGSQTISEINSYYSTLYLRYNYNEVMSITGQFANELFDTTDYSNISRLYIKTDEQFTMLKEAFENKYNITIDGNYHSYIGDAIVGIEAQ